MFPFFKKKPSNHVPEWASIFSVIEYNKFLTLVGNYFTRQKIAYSIENGEVTLDNDSFGGVLGLVNLAQTCKQAKPVEWKKIIADHFDSMQKAALSQEDFDSKVHDFAFAEEYLAVRIYNSEYLRQLDSSATIGKDLADDLFAMLAFDLPNSVTNVKPEQTIQWNKNNEELFELGLQNVQANYEVDIQQMDMGNFTILFAQGDHFFVPNIIFHLEDYPQLLGIKGCLLGIPHRHLVIVYPIENIEVASVAGQLIHMIQHIHKEGPGSISDSLYWYYEGETIKLPYTQDDKNLTLSPPEAFEDMLHELGEE